MFQSKQRTGEEEEMKLKVSARLQKDKRDERRQKESKRKLLARGEHAILHTSH